MTRSREEEEWRRRIDAREQVARQTEPLLRARPGTGLPETVLPVQLPGLRRPLERLSPARRTAFDARLGRLVAGLGTAPVLPSASPPAPEPPSRGRDALSANACAACRGQCCRAGAELAYLSGDTLRRVLRERPGTTADQVAEAYRSRLPPVAVAGSCIFHTAGGCALPRDLRADTCNRYVCAGLQNLQAALPPDRIPPVLAVVFDEHEAWIRTALLDGSGVRILEEAGPGGAEPGRGELLSGDARRSPAGGA